jgi:hypothetical protein
VTYYIDQDDGTRWFYSVGLDIWTGWVPGEDGCWTLTPDEYAASYAVTIGDAGAHDASRGEVGHDCP